METPQAESSSTPFPAGPTYPRLLESEAGVAWVRFKVWSADWYTATLARLFEDLGDQDRYIGVEMALDGALSALSGAFDAAVALLIEAAEQALGIDEAERTPSHKYKWRVAEDRLSALDGEAASHVTALIAEVDAALEGESTDNPSGWLARLRRLRNRSTHQSTLARTWDAGEGTHTVVGLSDVPGMDALNFLQRSCDRVSDLVERMLSVANLVDFIGASTPLHRTRLED